jgi:hypothetical protein
VSSDGGASYHTTVTLTPSSGTVASTTINVRIMSSAAVGAISGKITDTSTGATEQDVTVTGTVTAAAPTIVVSPNSLDLGTTATGTAGTAKTYTVSGTNLTAGLVITAPTGVEVSSDGGASYHTTVTLTPASGTVASTTINVRITSSAAVGAISGKITDTSTGATEQDVTVTGTVTAPAPTIVVSPNSLDLGTTQSGTAGTAQTYTVSGSNLTAGLVITAPTGVEVSSDGGTSYHTTVTLTPASGTVASTTINVRITSSAAVGAISGKITDTSTGATEQDVTVTGTVTAAAPTIVVSPNSLDLGTTATGTAGTAKTYTVSGTNLTAGLVITAPTGVEVSSDGGASYHTTVTLTPASGTVASTTINVRITSSAAVGAISGKITDTSTGATAQDVTVTGTVTAVTNVGTTTTVTSSDSTPVYGTAVTLTATVAPQSGSTVPTQGSVAFFINGTTSLGTGTFTGSDAANDALFSYVTTPTQLQVAAGAAQPITATYTAGAGFTDSTSTNSLTETVSPVTVRATGITASDKVYDATTKATLNTGSAALTGVITGDTVSLVTTGATGTFASKDVGTGITVTVSGLSLGGPQAGNYVLGSPVTTTANITPATLTVTGVTAKDKVYNGTTTATVDASGATLAGVLTGDTVTLDTTGAAGTFASKDVGTGITVQVSGLTIGGPQVNDYTLTQPTTTANITAATLTVTGVTAKDKVYNGTTAATVDATGATLAGVVTGDTVSLDATGAAGTFASKDVANGITVQVSGLTLGGPQAHDYTLTQPTTTANITPATLTVTGVTAKDKVYNGTTAATIDASGATLAGVVTGDTVTVDATGATGTFASKDVGTGITVTVSGLTLAGPQAHDYTLTQPTTTANITPATLTVTGVTAKDKVYNGTTTATIDASGATLAGVVTGDTVTLDTTGAAGAFASKDVANGITVQVSGLTIGGPQAHDYTLTQPTTTANITPATLTVTGVTAKDKVYNGTTTATVDATGATLAGVVTGDTVSLDATGATGTFASKDVGTGITVQVSGLTLGGPQAHDYTLTQPTTTANITPATLTVTGVTAKDKVYNGTTTATVDATNAKLAGVVTGDTVTVDATGATGTFASKDVGTGITVTVSGLTLAGPQANDYTLTQPVTTTANITAATLTVTGVTAKDKVYNGTTAATVDATNAKLVGVVTGDTVTLDTTGAAGTFASKDAGTGITVQVSGLTIGGPQVNDYTLTQPTTTANITAATLTVTGVTAKDKVYDSTTKATLNTGSAALVGVLSGDTVTLNSSSATGTFASKDVANGITVQASGLTLAGPQANDYTLTQPTTTANITAATLTVTGITANNKAFDGNTTATLNTAGATLVGVFSGDSVTLNSAGAVGTFANAGPGTNIPVTITGLTLSGAQAGDYTLTQPTTTANITPATTSILPKVSVNNLQTLEGTSGLTPFTFQVKLTNGSKLLNGTPTNGVTYDVFTTDGTAKAGTEFIGISPGVTTTNSKGTVTFAPGASTATVTVYVNAGAFLPTAATPKKTFTVNLSDPLNPTVALATGTGTIIAQTPKTPQLAAGTPAGLPGTYLNSMAQLTPIITAAEARWEQTGVPASKFQGVQFVIDNISNVAYHVLGNTAGKTITIDASAAGFGWFIDPAPMTDYSFQPAVHSTDLVARSQSPAMGHMDLLTVVEHELGHVLGYPDLTSGPDTLMSQDLSAGMRRLPTGAPSYISIVPPNSPAAQAGVQLLNLQSPLPLPQGSGLGQASHVSTVALDLVFVESLSTKAADEGPSALDKIFGSSQDN